jgi:hypothetical protein
MEGQEASPVVEVHVKVIALAKESLASPVKLAMYIANSFRNESG